MTFKEWEKSSGVYYHCNARDGDWTLDQALKACWIAAQRAERLHQQDVQRDQQNYIRSYKRDSK